MKILVLHFPCNKNLEQGKTFGEHTVKIENILIMVHKTFGFSRKNYIKLYIFCLLLSSIAIAFCYKMQKNFKCQGKKATLKHVLFAVAMKIIV